MKQVLIGSRAVKHYLKNARNCHDFDYLIDFDKPHEVKNGIRTEYYNCNRNPGLVEIFNKNEEVASLDDLLTLKVSHVFWPIKWDKTINDIVYLLTEASFNEKLYNQLYKGWEQIHSKKRANLMKKNEEFFSDAVNRKYVHDDIHKVMAYYDRPLYEILKDDKEKAYIPKKNFLALSQEDKLRLCREEIYVTALERYAIPANFKCSPVLCYRRAARKLITSMSKGWFPLFMVLNWSELRNPDRPLYFKVFQGRVNEVRSLEHV